MTQRVFTNEDQHAFARLSGDANPLHMDPISARRLMFGGRIVHGLHAVLWALDQFFDIETPALRLLTVKVAFQAAIGVGENVTSSTALADEGELEVRLRVDQTPVAWIKISWAPQDPQPPSSLPVHIPQKIACRQRSLEELATASGTLDLYLDRTLARQLFPHLTRVLPPRQLAGILATSRLVGMECPGWHSIFTGLELIDSATAPDKSNLAYQVVTCNPKLSLVLMTIQAAGMDGKIKAFLRPEVQMQANFADLSVEVEAQEFAQQRSLIIGGSRGLGEVSAKLLAAGGSEVILTYHQGVSDARRVVEEIVSGGGKATCIHFDVLDPTADLLSRFEGGSKPISLYYFATPFIFGSRKRQFSPLRFNTFCDYYVSGFLRTVETLEAGDKGLERIFYPSTTAIDEMPLDMGEYAAAKTAGERLCDFLQKIHPAIKIYKPRLPRLATDQTVSLLPVESHEPAPFLLPHLRELLNL